MFDYESKISLARPNSKSARTTIPKEVMKFLDLKIGDKVNWKVTIDGDKLTVNLYKKPKD